MDKKTIFRILNLSDGPEVVALGKALDERYNAITLKKPEKMLVMLKTRESAKNTLFYAGEALACECMVSIGESKGYAASLGDDLQKVHAMAIIDAALNAKLPESDMIYQTLESWQAKIREKHALEAGLAMSTKAVFNVMEE
ncbi:MAG: phosphonate C-P lyase system protein PhnG [Eubacteriaceae bacterium]|nr:phosphonate C-P lyase system protein PhnG [Eubacteriaceae bacterium]